MQPRRQNRNASAPGAVCVLRRLGEQVVRRPLSNRASRSLNSQFMAGALRRFTSHCVEGASRRLNSQSVAEIASPTQLGANAPNLQWQWQAYWCKPASVLKLVGHAPAKRMYRPSRLYSVPPALPNPSLKLSANGRLPGPPAAVVYLASVGPGTLPSSPA